MADLMRGKRGLIMGVANERSIAWGIAKACADQGAELALTYQGEAFKKRVEPLANELGAFVAALPMVTVLALIWLYVEKQPQAKIANHAWYTFWYVVPTLPMFLAFPFLLGRIGFWPTMAASVVITVACFGVFALALRPFGIQLLP